MLNEVDFKIKPLDRGRATTVHQSRLKKCFIPKVKQNNVTKTITPQLQLNENLPTNGAHLVSFFESEPVTNTHQLQDEPFEQINSSDSSDSPILMNKIRS